MGDIPASMQDHFGICMYIMISTFKVRNVFPLNTVSDQRVKE